MALLLHYCYLLGLFFGGKGYQPPLSHFMAEVKVSRNEESRSANKALFILPTFANRSFVHREGLSVGPLTEAAKALSFLQ